MKPFESGVDSIDGHLEDRISRRRWKSVLVTQRGYPYPRVQTRELAWVSLSGEREGPDGTQGPQKRHEGAILTSGLRLHVLI